MKTMSACFAQISSNAPSLHILGFKAVMKCLRNGQSKLIIVANNCPAIRKTQLEYMAILGGSKVLHFDGNNIELGK